MRLRTRILRTVGFNVLCVTWYYALSFLTGRVLVPLLAQHGIVYITFR